MTEKTDPVASLAADTTSTRFTHKGADVSDTMKQERRECDHTADTAIDPTMIPTAIVDSDAGHFIFTAKSRPELQEKLKKFLIENTSDLEEEKEGLDEIIAAYKKQYGGDIACYYPRNHPTKRPQ